MSTAKDLLVIDVSEVSYCPDPNDPHNPPRDVRDIREAMHPPTHGDLMREATIAAGLPPEAAPTFTFAQPGPPTVYVNAPHVATLPDGSRVNLPAGTVLREGEEAIPEHPVIALVRSFIGKPGDRGPVWSALEQLQVRIDAGDLAAVRSAGIELAAALNHRLGQMHDALGRDTTEDRTL